MGFADCGKIWAEEVSPSSDCTEMAKRVLVGSIWISCFRSELRAPLNCKTKFPASEVRVERRYPSIVTYTKALLDGCPEGVITDPEIGFEFWATAISLPVVNCQGNPLLSKFVPSELIL